MAIRKIKDYQGVKNNYYPRQRKPFVDYDYYEKLTADERNWLGRFSFEYYGADFIINPTFTPDENGEMVDITWMDFRKIGKIPKFYKMPNGEFTESTDYKYSDKNIHPKEYWKDLRKYGSALKVDMMSAGFNHTNGRDEDAITHLITGGIESCDPLTIIEYLTDDEINVDFQEELQSETDASQS